MRNMDEVLTEIVIASEKARFQAGQFNEDMQEEKENDIIIYEHNGMRIRCDIAHDYIVQVDEKVNEMMGIFRELWEEMKNGAKEGVEV